LEDILAFETFIYYFFLPHNTKIDIYDPDSREEKKTDLNITIVSTVSQEFIALPRKCITEPILDGYSQDKCGNNMKPLKFPSYWNTIYQITLDCRPFDDLLTLEKLSTTL
jgi:hypothetical protein